VRGSVDHLDELLRLVDAPNIACTRFVLDLCIQCARGQAEYSKETSQTPAALLQQLDKSISKTVLLLRKLESYPRWRDVCGRIYASGDGIAVAGKLILPRNPPPRKRGWLGIPKIGADNPAIMVNIRGALNELQEEVRRAAEEKRKRGQPEKWDKSICVDYAIHFFELCFPS
jgi:hypothetical protein